MPFTENTFIRLAESAIDQAEEMQLFALKRLAALNRRIINDPTVSINVRAEAERMQRQIDAYIQRMTGWTDRELSEAYKRGLISADRQARGRTITSGFIPSRQLTPNIPGAPISDAARRVLSDFPDHFSVYGVFQQATINNFQQTRLPIIRQHSDRIREIAIMAGEATYRDADVFTRRQMSQSLMNQYAKEGISGVRYADGRTMPIDSYSEMVARTQTGNAARVANMNRLQEYEIDLVAISVHFPTSDLCEPFQGRVFSMSGTTEGYTALDEAIEAGLYHANCKHTQSGFTPGVSELPDRDVSTTENRKQYEASQQQRYNERQIRSWKRREAASVESGEADKAKAKVREWQGRQREHLGENQFLRRDYTREQI